MTSAYDFESRMISSGATTDVYDCNGSRVAETNGGVTTTCLVDTVNPTGLQQVVDELVNGSVSRT